ncbi:MAG: hypothetical protein ABI175_24555 [Polyangiales bacterium]
MKKILTFVALAIVAVIGLSFAVGLGMYASHRDNREKCDSPLGPSATSELSIELPDGVQVCRKLDRPGSADLELLVESPGPLCFASMGQLGCPSVIKNQLAFMRAMTDAGWGTGEVEGDVVRFNRGKGEGATVRFRKSRYGEIAASMTVYSPTPKVGKK